MLTSTATVATPRASRYRDQLASHGAGMLRVRHRGDDDAGGPPIEAATVADDTVVLTFAWGRCSIRAADADDALLLVVEAETHAGLARIQHGVGQRVATIGRRDGLTVSWTPAQGEISDEASPAASVGRHRGALTAVAVVLLAMVVLAVHLGIGAALLHRHWAWWALAAIAVLVLLKLVVARHVLAVHSHKRGG